MKTNAEIAKTVQKESSLWRGVRRLAPIMQVRQIMIEKGIKNVDLAERLGVTEANVSRLLKGDKNLQLDTLHLISDAIGSDLNIEFRTADVRQMEQHQDNNCDAANPESLPQFSLETVPDFSFSSASVVVEIHTYRAMKKRLSLASANQKKLADSEEAFTGQDIDNESRAAYA